MSKDVGSAAIRRIGIDDLTSCLALSIDRGWWPERTKWEWMLEGTEGWGIDAPDGNGLAGTTALTRWGDSRGAVGVMLVASRYGGQGYGRALMEHALDSAGEGVALSLYATSSGRPLYEKLGFKPVRRNIAFRGKFRVSKKADKAGEVAGAPGIVRVATEEDLKEIIALDRVTYGADREWALALMPTYADRIVVFEGNAGITGYAAAWRTEPYMHVGPLVAADGAAARLLVSDLGAHSPVPIRVDLDPDRPELPAWVRACGLAPTEHTTFMTRGDLTPVGVPEHVYTPVTVAMA
jgi:GNAT superfamily N-acetyltransferase